MKIKQRMLQPATMYVLLVLIVVFFSWIFDIYGLSVMHPQTGEEIRVQSLLGSESIRWLLRNVINNFTGFAPLGMAIVAIFGIGVAQHSGFITACIRRGAKKGQNRRKIIGWIILAGILSNVIGDTGYIILLPVAAILFQSAGLHPLGGIITAYVSVACGYSANVVVSTLDPIITQITQEAAIAAGVPYGNTGPLCNYYFMFVSTFLISAVVYYVTVKKLFPALGTYENETYITDYKQLSHRERRSLFLALSVGALYLLPVLWATFSPQGVLRGITDGLTRSPFIMGILFIVSFGAGLMGAVYGFSSGRYRTDRDVIEGLTQPMRSLSGYFVIAFFAAQMFACLEYSRLDKCVAIMSAELFSSLEFSGPGMILLFILFTAFIDLFMVSATSKWTFMAFIFVPVFANANVPPEMTQCAFRIGDSAANAVTPFLFYMPLTLTYMRQYDENITYGSLLRYTWRYSLYILAAWMLLFAGWYLSGLPLGL